ncbi:hypothetical protein Tco_0855069, partial [Tanacetum coccineum]
KQSDALPAKKLRTDHPSLASGTYGKTLANLEHIMPEGSHLLAQEQPLAPSVVPPSQESKGFVDLSAQGSFQILATAESSGTLSAPVDTVVAATTSTRPATASKATTDVGPFHPEESESSDDSFYEILNVDPAMAKRWYVPKWNTTNDSLLDDAFSCRTLVDRVAPSAFFYDLRTMSYDQLFTEFNVGQRGKYAWGRSSSLSGEKSALTAEVSVLKDRLISEVSSLHVDFQDFKKKMEVQEEEQAQELYNRVAELEAHLALLKCLKSSEYQGILGHAFKSLSTRTGPAAGLSRKPMHYSPLPEQLTVPIHHTGDKMIVGETSLSFALMNVYSLAEEAKKHAAALRKLMIDIVSNPLSSQTWVGEASTSAAPLSVEDYHEEDTD